MHTALLHETKQSPVCKTSEIVAKSKTCTSIVQSFLAALQEEGMVTLSGEEIRITPEQRMQTAELAISKGADPERVAKALGWQEFEGLAAHILRREGYTTANHFVFKHYARKYEIDVIGAKEPMVLCVDCKHWRHGWAPSKIRTAARNQLLRVQSLSEVFGFYERKHHIAGWPSARLLPIVVALADVHSKLMDGVPIVSALRLRDFLCHISPWDERLRFVDVPVGKQARLFS